MKFLFLIFAVIILGCSGNKQNESSECSKDSDCIKAGCSGQLCVPLTSEGIITTCEYREEYGCLRETTCSCISRKCAWKETKEYKGCLEGLK